MTPDSVVSFNRSGNPVPERLTGNRFRAGRIVQGRASRRSERPGSAGEKPEEVGRAVGTVGERATWDPRRCSRRGAPRADGTTGSPERRAPSDPENGPARVRGTKGEVGDGASRRARPVSQTTTPVFRPGATASTSSSVEGVWGPAPCDPRRY